MEITSLYEKEEFQNDAKEYFNSHGHLQLQIFFSSDSVKEMQQLLLQKKIKSNYDPLSHQYFEFEESNLKTQIEEFFKSKTFQEVNEKITGFPLDFQKTEISLFKHKSYELILDSKITNSMVIEVYFFITLNDFENEDGGFKVYTTFDEEILYLNIVNNTMTYVFKDEELRQYTKYINSLAKNKEYIQIKTTYEIAENITDELL